MSVRWIRVLAIAVLSLLIALPASSGLAGPAAAADLPGGKGNYVVSFGSLYPDYGSNWVRLGTYVFTADGRVRSDTWAWSQANPSPRVGTGTVPSGACSGTADTVRPCDIKTVSGFLSPAPEARTGSYTLHSSGGRQFVNVQWDQATWRSEEWWVDVAPSGTYSRLTFKYSQKFTHGYGYGSNAGLGARRPMDTVRNHQAPLTMTYHRAALGAVAYKQGGWAMDRYVHCTGTTWCLTYKIQQASEGTCECAAPYDGDRSIQNYIQKLSNTDRRDTFWHWCTCLAKGSPCYAGNSHVYPLLQVIDDNGSWRGWVGVEASFYPYAATDARKRDMLSVFRVAEWT
jgi:hypothetical protein